MIEILLQFLKGKFVRGQNEVPSEPSTAIEALRQEFLLIAEQLSAPGNLVWFYTQRQDDGAYHLEILGDEYKYISTERGKTLSIRTTRDPKEVLFWLTKNLTRQMALKYEMDHRVAGQDSRRIWFAKHVELLRSINHAWAEQVEEYYKSILVDHPFDDRPLTERYPACDLHQATGDHENSPRR